MYFNRTEKKFFKQLTHQRRLSIFFFFGRARLSC